MALEEFVGAVVMEVDGAEIEITSINVDKNTGRSLVKTMNRSGRPAGFKRGVAEISLRVTAVIPVKGSPVRWEDIEGVKITLQPVGGGKRFSYTDAFTISVGAQYSVDNEARIDLQMAALREVEE